MTDFGCAVSGITSVCLYDTLGKESIDYILDQAKIKTVACSSDKVKTLAELKKDGKISTTTHVIFFGPALENEVIELAKQGGLTVVNFE